MSLDDERAHLVPHIKRTDRMQIFRGYEIEFERINRFGERSASLVVGELSIQDLEALAEHLNWYLDEGRYQE